MTRQSDSGNARTSPGQRRRVMPGQRDPLVVIDPVRVANAAVQRLNGRRILVGATWPGASVLLVRNQDGHLGVGSAWNPAPREGTGAAPIVGGVRVEDRAQVTVQPGETATAPAVGVEIVLPSEGAVSRPGQIGRRDRVAVVIGNEEGSVASMIARRRQRRIASAVTVCASAMAGPEIVRIVADQNVADQNVADQNVADPPEEFRVVHVLTVPTGRAPTGSRLRGPTVARRRGRSSTYLVRRKRPDETNNGPKTEAGETRGSGPTIGGRVPMVRVVRIPIENAGQPVVVHRAADRPRLTPSATR